MQDLHTRWVTDSTLYILAARVDVSLVGVSVPEDSKVQAIGLLRRREGMLTTKLRDGFLPRDPMWTVWVK